MNQKKSLNFQVKKHSRKMIRRIPTLLTGIKSESHPGTPSEVTWPGVTNLENFSAPKVVCLVVCHDQPPVRWYLDVYPILPFRISYTSLILSTN